MTPREKPPEWSLDQCLKCNICTTVCPVSAVTDLFPGPKYVGPQAGRFRMPAQATPDISVDYCSGCRACNLACPAGVKIAEINARARRTLVAQGNLPPLRRLRNNLIARSGLIGKLGQPVAPLANYALGNGALRKVMEVAIGIHHRAPLPPFARQRFSAWFKRHPRPSGTRRQVVYFHGCATEYYEPRIGRACVSVLERNGCEVLVPPQDCCGLPLLSNGEFPAAQACHLKNVRSLAPYTRQGIPIVGTSTSCTLTLKEEAPKLLDLHGDDVRAVAEMTYDISEFLLLLLEAEALDLDLAAIPLDLPYHQPCQYRAHGLGRPASEIMELIPGLQITESQAACCGIAGTYGYKLEKYQIGMDVGRSLFEFVHRSGAPLAVCDSETCRWQITHATGIPAIHPVELLAAAYGCPPEGALGGVLARLAAEK
jgi:glycerol-3-phosphate dehydrogenase subunit C